MINILARHKNYSSQTTQRKKERKKETVGNN